MAALEGYMEDAQGRFNPIERIAPIDLARNELVLEQMKRAQELQTVLADFKTRVMDDIQAFIELSGEKYGAKLGGNKGNVVLYSYDGRYKLIRAIGDFIAFDERIQAAKALIDECLKLWCEGSNSKLRVLVNDAFQVDKTGRINVKKVLSLRRSKIDDENWKQAMQAISDSVQVVNSKAYVRFYERQPDGSYRQLALDVAA